MGDDSCRPEQSGVLGFPATTLPARMVCFIRQQGIALALGWAARTAQNRLFNLPRGQEESALPSFGPKGFLYLVVLFA